MQGRFGRAQKFGESTGNIISKPLKKLESLKAEVVNQFWANPVAW